MFTLFLTSSPYDESGVIYRKNGFRDELLRQLPGHIRGLYITSAPDDFYGSECASGDMCRALQQIGIKIIQWTLLDRRNQFESTELVRNSDLIILGGGHVPTQHRFFQEMFLREELRSFDGTLITISAGSMNCADIVYSLPEYDGESVDPHYQRFFTGLGLTSVQILPHYYSWIDRKIDGRNAYQEIAAPDSYRTRLYVFPDGTYLFSKYGYEEVRGECFIMENGIFRKVAEDGQKVLLPII